MTDEELRGIDKRVAVEMGWRVEVVAIPELTNGRNTGFALKDANGKNVRQGGGVYGWGRTDTVDNAWAYCPHFSRDPAAASLIEKRLQEEGFWIRACWAGSKWQYDLVKPTTGVDGFFTEWWGYVEENVERETALCLAFLAACEAKNEVKS